MGDAPVVVNVMNYRRAKRDGVAAAGADPVSVVLRALALPPPRARGDAPGVGKPHGELDENGQLASTAALTALLVRKYGGTTPGLAATLADYQDDPDT